MIYQRNKGSGFRRPWRAVFFLAAGLISGLLAGCGYRMGSSPYQLDEPLVVSVPMAMNKTTNAGLAATLTRLVVESLAASPQITVVGPGWGEEAGRPLTPDYCVLQLTIAQVRLEGGAWEVESNDQVFSVSRRVYLTVEGLLSRQDVGGRSRPPIRRTVTTNRAYQVSSDQTRLETNQAYATDLALAEAAQKLLLVMFNDF